MGRFCRIALALFGVMTGVAASPALAGQSTVESRLELNGRTLSLSTIEMNRLSDLGQTVRGSRAAQDRALAAAQDVVSGPDARFALATYQLAIGQQRGDDALRAQALDVLIANRELPQDRLVGYLGLRGDIAYRHRELATAASAWGRLAELQPDNPQALINLAQVRQAGDDAAGAVDLLRRATELGAHRRAALPETAYRQWVSIAYNGRLPRETAQAGQALVAAYPTAENWRFALAAYRQLAAPQGNAELDLLRLMRAAGALTREAEYQRFSQLLNQAGLPREAKAVIEEGMNRLLVDPVASPTPDIVREIDRALSRPSGSSPDALLGERRYAEAAARYLAAMQQGGADRPVLATRRGMALALADQDAEADAVLNEIAQTATSQSPYPDLARFWRILARRGAAR